MVFSSLVFLFAFLPAFLAVYFLVPWRAAKNVVLLLFSLAFYAWGEPVYVWLMAGSIAANWALALGIARGRQAGRPAVARAFLLAAVAANLVVLGFFKYEGFLAANVNRLAGFALVPDLELALPVGISFFTLQALSYVADVYRGEAAAQRNVLYLGMYVAMFPQLVAGPIVRYSQIEEAIGNRRATLAGFAQGARLFAVGLGKKVLLANTAAVLSGSLLSQSPQAIGAVGCLSAVLAYTFQIYFDFGGYSDMAVGLGKMMGFDYPRNFNYPYLSRSATEFWRRWHVTLGSFFRDYVYVPLGGSRVPRARWMLNIAVVWGLTGVWHGAAWNFVLWGLYWGALVMCEKLFLLRALGRAPRAVGHAYCVLAFTFGWMLFAVGGGLGNLARWAAGCLGLYGLTGTSTLWELQSWGYVSLVPVLVAGCLPLFPWLRRRVEAWAAADGGAPLPAAPERGNDAVPPCQVVVPAGAPAARARACAALNALVDVALLAVLLASCASLAAGGYNPFIYFQF